MNKNFIGWVLIFLLSVLFFKYNEKKTLKNKDVENVVNSNSSKNIEKGEISNTIKYDKKEDVFLDLKRKKKEINENKVDKNDGLFLENKSMKVYFSRLGGAVSKVELKNFKNHEGKNVVLLDDNSFVENLNISIKEDIDNVKVYDSYITNFDVEKIKDKDEDIEKIVFTYYVNNKINNGVNFVVKNVFWLNKNNDYVLDREISFGPDVKINSVKYQLKDSVKRQETNLDDCRKKTTIKYLDISDKQKELNAFSSKDEKVGIKKSKWVNIIQKFFSVAIIAEESFEEVNVLLKNIDDVDNKDFVKEAKVSFNVNIENNKIFKMRYYFGPNNVNTMSNVSKFFDKNIYFGWPGVRLINRYLITPIIKKMSDRGFNPGLIIILIVLLLKLLLLPLMFRSYLSMIKMRILSPYLEDIQREYGSDFQKSILERDKIFKKSGVNPLSQVFTEILQVPFWMAVYNSLSGEISFRQKTMLWCRDMSNYDSILTLPFYVPLYGDHVSLFALLMLVFVLTRVIWSQKSLNFSKTNFIVLIFFIPICMMTNNLCASVTFYFFVSSFVAILLQKIISFFVDEKEIKNKIDFNLKQQSDFKKRVGCN